MRAAAALVLAWLPLASTAAGGAGAATATLGAAAGDWQTARPDLGLVASGLVLAWLALVMLLSWARRGPRGE